MRTRSEELRQLVNDFTKRIDSLSDKHMKHHLNQIFSGSFDITYK